jgi:hypothetical protein
MLYSSQFTFRVSVQIWALLWFCLIGMASAAFAQQDAAIGTPLVIHTVSLPKGFLHQAYHFQLEAEGGIKPLKWTLASGSLPPGINLEDSGLQGTPNQTGEFRFTLTLSDSGKPAQEVSKEFVLKVVVTLFAEWGRPPKVVGQRIEGSVKVSNQTDYDLDLTFIALAVNEIGRATAIGYQHFTLKKDQSEFEIPVGETLARGAYDVHVDVVGEVAETNSIYRAHLQSKGKLEVQQGP